MKTDLLSKGFIFFSFCLFVLSPNFSFADESEELEFDEELELEDFELDDEELELDELELDEDDFFEIDEDIESLLEEFEVEEEEVVQTDQFIISGIIGNTMPFGQNLKSKFSSGSNFGIRVDTPYYIFVGPFELNIGGEIYFSSMKSKGITEDYKLTNLIGSLSTSFKSIIIRGGVGFSPTSSGNDSAFLLTTTVDFSYKVPIKTNPISLFVNFHAQETFGEPFAGTGTSDIIGLGLIIGYPISF